MIRLRPSSMLPVRSALTLFAVCFLTACAGSGAPGTTVDARLIGVWVDEGGSHHTIAASDGGYAIGVVDSDGEVFDVVSVTWEEGVLSWTYDVLSTGYRVSHETTRISADRLDVHWENQSGGSGVDVLTRAE